MTGFSVVKNGCFPIVSFPLIVDEQRKSTRKRRGIWPDHETLTDTLSKETACSIVLAKFTTVTPGQNSLWWRA